MLKKIFCACGLLMAVLYASSSFADPFAVCCYSPNYAAVGSMWVGSQTSNPYVACAKIDWQAYGAGNCSKNSPVYPDDFRIRNAHRLPPVR